MKYFVFIGLLFFSIGAQAQDKQDSEQVKEVLMKVLELAQSEADDHELAKYIVYRGKDEDRKWKDICNYNDADERMRVRIVRLNIQKRFLPYEYEFHNFHQETESEGTWNVWEMKYTKNGEARKMYFAFLKINGKFALGDIDSD